MNNYYLQKKTIYISPYSQELLKLVWNYLSNQLTYFFRFLQHVHRHYRLFWFSIYIFLLNMLCLLRIWFGTSNSIEKKLACRILPKIRDLSSFILTMNRIALKWNSFKGFSHLLGITFCQLVTFIEFLEDKFYSFYGPLLIIVNFGYTRQSRMYTVKKNCS